MDRNECKRAHFGPEGGQVALNQHHANKTVAQVCTLLISAHNARSASPRLSFLEEAGVYIQSLNGTLKISWSNSAQIF